jgi:hypothetical protein
MKNLTKIILVIILVIVLIIHLYFSYVSIKNYLQAYESIKYTINNKLECPEDKLYCEYINKDLPEPKPTDNILTFSKYAANLIGKIEYDHKAPLPIELNIYYNDVLFGWVLKGDNAYYVVYRGTRTLKEWMENFNYYQNTGTSIINFKPKMKVKQQVLMIPDRNLKNKLRDISGEDIKVHQGFLNIYNSFKDKVMEVLEKDKNKPIIITGHSLGSAVAILTGVDLTLKNRQTQTIVFASPRIGNTAFANLLNSQTNLLKWTNTSDVIPTMPYSVAPNFNNPKDPYFFTDGGATNFFTINNRSLVNNHLIYTYIQYLDSIQS